MPKTRKVSGRKRQTHKMRRVTRKMRGGMDQINADALNALMVKYGVFKNGKLRTVGDFEGAIEKKAGKKYIDLQREIIKEPNFKTKYTRPEAVFTSPLTEEEKAKRRQEEELRIQEQELRRQEQELRRQQEEQRRQEEQRKKQVQRRTKAFQYFKAKQEVQSPNEIASIRNQIATNEDKNKFNSFVRKNILKKNSLAQILSYVHVPNTQRKNTYNNTEEGNEAMIIDMDLLQDRRLLEKILKDTKVLIQNAGKEELGLFVAMKLFSLIQVFRAAPCPTYKPAPYTIEFLSSGTINGIDINYREYGLELLIDYYKELAKQKEETTSLYGLKQVGSKISDTFGVQNRASRKQMIEFLIDLKRKMIVTKDICEWLKYANRLAYDFKFPSVQQMLGTLNKETINELEKLEQKQGLEFYNETQIGDMIWRAVKEGGFRGGIFLTFLTIGVGLPPAWQMLPALIKDWRKVTTEYQR